jgi:catechol 2,3-dioxygenase-like lactoylglutathione lyase family enzyme
MKQKLNLITLGVENINRAVEFYEKGLGWKRSVASTDDMVVFSLGGIALSLYPRAELADDIGISSNGSGFSGITLSHNVRSEEEADDVMDLVKRLGATIIKPAQKVFWGGYSGYFRDPDGHLFEVAYNPHWKLDKDDNLVLP